MFSAPRAALLFARLAAGFTLVTVALGSVVCATRSGFDCHSWPGCYPDRFAPGASDISAALVANPALEMVHRVIAMSTGGVLIVAAVLVSLAPTPTRTLKLLPWLACLAAGGSALYGRASVLGLGVDAVGAAVDLLCALVAMALSLVTAVVLGRGARFTLNRVSAPALLAASVLVTMHVTGQLAAGVRSFTRCLSWPILWLAHDDNLTMQLLRTGLAVAAVALLTIAVRAAMRDQAKRVVAVTLAVEVVAVIALAIAYRATGTDGGMLGIALSLASVAVLWTTILLGARAAVRQYVASERPRDLVTA